MRGEPHGVAARWLCMALLSSVCACDPSLSDQCRVGPRLPLNLHGGILAVAMCDFHERCEAVDGRFAIDQDGCLAYADMWDLTDLAPTTAACAADLAAATCGTPLADISAACDSIFDFTAASDETCSSAWVPINGDYAKRCDPGLVCLADETGGSHCERCTPPPGSGQPCDLGICAAGLACNASWVCEDISGKSCAQDRDCSDNTSLFFCDGTNGCQYRAIGSPCWRADTCGATGLVCRGAMCAARPTLGQSCVRSSDCDPYPQLRCITGVCVPALQRGEACTGRDQCRGWLICNPDGICADRPGEDEACTEECLAPAICYVGVCRVFWPPTMLFEGDLCSPCEGRCQNGFCDSLGRESTNRCVPYLPVGESCLTADTCDPTRARCGGNYSDLSCAPTVPIGGICTNDRECAAVIYCANGRCAPKLPDGSPCNRGEACVSDKCYGTCAAGSQVGMPCIDNGACPSSSCDGRCGPYNPFFELCGN